MVKLLGAAFALLLSLSVSADSIRFGGWSKHFDSNYEYNEKHNAFVYENDYTGLAAGYFYNSYRDDTYVLGKQFKTEFGSGIEGRLNVLAVHGYRSCRFNSDNGSKKLCPAVYPELRLNGGGGNPGLVWMWGAVAVTLGFDW